MTTQPLSKRTFLMLCGSALCGVAAPGSTARGASAPEPASLSIGTFDSRAIAVAAANSKYGRDLIQPQVAAHAKAKAANDAQKMQAIGDEMELRQRHHHEQAFSTGSVRVFMEIIRDQLPGIASSAGVIAIVSKWELAYSADGIRTVDVTDALIKAFNPSEQGRKWAKDIQRKPPIPLSDLPTKMD